MLNKIKNNKGLTIAFLILIVVIFDNILESTLSIRPVSFECL